MADEVAPLLVQYGIDEFTSAEVIEEINECISHNEQMVLVLDFPARDEDLDEGEDDENYELFKFDATDEMQNTIAKNSRLIKTITVFNGSNDKDEHIRCFNFFIRIIQGLIGNGKHLTYVNDKEKMDALLFEGVINQLAEAVLQSNNNNNNNDAIESFHFDELNLNPGTVQPLLDALLDSGVRNISLWSYDFFAGRLSNNTNNNINFTGMETNESLKELNLFHFDMQKEDYWNLFHSIKKKQRIRKMEIQLYLL